MVIEGTRQDNTNHITTWLINSGWLIDLLTGLRIEYHPVTQLIYLVNILQPGPLQTSQLSASTRVNVDKKYCKNLGHW